MGFTNDFAADQVTIHDNGTAGADAMTELLSTNWQTSAAVGLTVATGGVTGAIMLAAFPAQTLTTAAAVGTLAYAGKRRADGKDALPFVKDFLNKDKDAKSDDEATAKQEKVETRPIDQAS